MHPLEKNILKTIQQEKLLQAGEKVLIGVSAGPDSMALLHVLVRLAPDLGITLAAAYVNHGLRPQEAENEKNLVETEARCAGIDFLSGSVDVKSLAARRKFSIEQAARLLRYDFLEHAAQKSGAQKIALGHTADDQAEEILLRLIRGTARKGLSGMKTIRDGLIIRPFLLTPKSQLLEYLEKHSIPFLLDSSNMEDVYLRNRIRNDLLPYVAERYNPDFRQTLLRTAAILQDEEELFEEITKAAYLQTVTIIPETLEQTKSTDVLPGDSHPQTLQINLELFLSQPRAIQRRLLEKCSWHMNCEPRSRQIDHLLQLARSSSSEGDFHLADGLRVFKSKELLKFIYPLGKGPLRGNIQAVAENDFPETTIPAPGCYEFPVLNRKLLVENIENSFPGSGEIFPTGEYLDAGLFSFPLFLRGPRTGDRFHPLGAPGSKKVNDFLGDQKISKDQRPLVPVLGVDETILALPGLRIDHRYRITDNTTQVIRVRWEKMKQLNKTEG